MKDVIFVTSPNYPGNYGNNLDCRWTFTTTGGAKLHFQFLTFMTEYGRDYLDAEEALGGWNIKIINGLSGGDVPDEFTTRTSTAWVSFHSDGTTSDTGFEFQVTVIVPEASAQSTTTSPTSPTPRACGGNYNLQIGDTITVTSPNYPHHYGSLLDCLWTFTATDGAKLNVNFDSFNTEQYYDLLEAGEGLGPLDGITIRSRQSGHTVPDNFTTNSSKAWITFNSDSSNGGTGFEITITAQ
ncbi:bone morphogenetic protein 1-like [Glandiceps talaboti]